jgi:hypothetical protein
MRGRIRDLVAAIHFYATSTDQLQLLDYLGEPDEVSLLPWPLVQSLGVSLTRAEALSSAQVMVVSHRFGQPTIIRDGDGAMAEPSKSGVFNGSTGRG